jgi:hypothetical protein
MKESPVLTTVAVGQACQPTGEPLRTLISMVTVKPMCAVELLPESCVHCPPEENSHSERFGRRGSTMSMAGPPSLITGG